jgi:hypothetical protein
MKSYEERMRFLIEFHEIDLASMRVGALKDLQADILDLVGGPDWYEIELTVDVLEDLQVALMLSVAVVEEARPGAKPYPFIWETGRDVGIEFEVVGMDVVPSIRPEDRRKLSLIEAFNFQVMVAFCKADLSRLRHCKEKCLIDRDGKPLHRCFYAEHGNQQYCSARCTNRAKNRRYREQKNLARENL